MAPLKSTDPQAAASPEDGAAYWFAREQTLLLTRQERDKRDSWLGENPDNRQAYERATALWGGLNQLAAHEQMRKLRREALDARPVVRPMFQRWHLAAAAVLAGLLAGGYWIHRSSLFDSSRTTLASEPDKGMEPRYRTSVGERSTVTLKDGSLVTLNTASELRVRFGESERAVELMRGQAYFSVAKDPRHPFVVIAGGRRITAIGTVFDVRLDQDQVQVVLVEGQVAVNPLGVAANRVELSPGERFVSRGDTSAGVSTANVEALTSWRSGRIIFADTSIADAIAEVNRYRDRPITIADTAIGELKISGTYRVSESDRFPKALAAYYPLEFTVRPFGETVLRWRQGHSAK